MVRSLRWYRYVWSELTGPTLLGLLLFTFLLLMNAFFLVAEKALAKNLGWELTLRMFSYEVPRLLVLAIPMAVLLGALIAMGRISAESEWIALQSAGYGPSRLLRPLFVWGLGASLISFAIYGTVVPRANYAGRTLTGEVIFLSNLASDLRPGAFYTQLPGAVMFVSSIRAAEEGRMEGVLVHRSRPHGDADELILARYGDLYPLPDGSGQLAIELREGVLHRFNNAEPDSYQSSRFERYRDALEAHAFVRGLRDAPDRTVLDMGPLELWRELGALERGEDNSLHETTRAIRLRTTRFELHRRMALPLASLMFAVLALPLGVRRARSGKGAGFALSLFVIALYWVVFTFAQGQSLRGDRLPVWLGAWSGNLVLVPWAALGYWRLRRSRGEGRGPLRTLLVEWPRQVHALTARRAAAAPAVAPTPGRGVESGSLPVDSPASALAELGGTPNRFIRRLDQYVALRYVRLVGLTLAAAYLIYTIVDLKRLVEGMMQNDHPPHLLVRYMIYSLPGMLNLALPVACMVGGIATFTLLLRAGEMTAIKASGISARRALTPVLLLTGAMSVMLFLVQDRVRLGGDDGRTIGWALAPTTNRKADELKDQILGRAPITTGMPAGGQWAFGPRGRRLYHYRLHDPDRGVFQGLSVITVERDPPRILDHRFSPLARWDGERWLLDGFWYRTFPPDGSPGRYESSDEETRVALDPPDNFTRRDAIVTSRGGRLQEQMSLDELSDQIRDLGASGYDTTRLEVAYWSKLAQALSPLVMVVLGLPFAFRVGRRGSLYGIGVAILLVIVYWATFAVFNALGLETILPPLLAAWTPNILYGTLGVYLMLYIST